MWAAKHCSRLFPTTLFKAVINPEQVVRFYACMSCSGLHEKFPDSTSATNNSLDGFKMLYNPERALSMMSETTLFFYVSKCAAWTILLQHNRNERDKLIRFQ